MNINQFSIQEREREREEIKINKISLQVFTIYRLGWGELEVIATNPLT